MTEDQERVIKTVVSVGATALMLGIMVAIAWPGAGERLKIGGQWARYYRWRAWWIGLPSWVREAAVVRGKGPA